MRVCEIDNKLNLPMGSSFEMSRWSDYFAYEYDDGQKDTVIGIIPTPRGKKTTPQPNYSTVKGIARFLGWSSKSFTSSSMNDVCVRSIN